MIVRTYIWKPVFLSYLSPSKDSKKEMIKRAHSRISSSAFLGAGALHVALMTSRGGRRRRKRKYEEKKEAAKAMGIERMVEERRKVYLSLGRRRRPLIIQLQS